MQNALPLFHVSSKKVARAVERFGEEFWYKILSSSLGLNFCPFPSRERPPQTPQMLSRSQVHISSALDFETVAKTSPGVVKELEKRPVFQIIFLGDDENQAVEVKEVDEIDFVEVKMRVENGDSVFITKRESEKMDVGSLGRKKKRPGVSLGRFGRA